MILTDILSLIVLSGILAGLAAIYYKFTRRIKRFVEPMTADIPSELAQYADLIAQVIVARAMASLKGSDMNARSLEVRQQKAVNKAIVQDTLANASPLLGILANQYPNLIKAIAKNQELIPFALEMAAKIGTKGGNGHSDHVKPLPFDNYENL